MSWVDYDRDDRWSMTDLRAKARATLDLEYDDAQDLQVKAAQLSTGGFMTTAERTRWDAYVARKGALDAQVADEWARMQLLQQVFAVEVAQRGLYYDYPELPLDDPGYLERQQQRTALQAIVNAATPVIQAVVDQRARVQPPPPPEVPA